MTQVSDRCPLGYLLSNDTKLKFYKDVYLIDKNIAHVQKLNKACNMAAQQWKVSKLHIKNIVWKQFERNENCFIKVEIER